MALEQEQGEVAAVAAPAPAKSRRSPARLYLRLGLIGLVLLGFFLFPVPNNVTEDCRLFAVERTVVRPSVAGWVEAVAKVDGERVEKGEVIARLSRRELEEEQARAAAQLQQQRALLA